LDEIADPFQGAIGRIAKRIERRTLAAPLVESPARTAEQTEDYDGRDDLTNPALAVPRLQLCIRRRLGRRRRIYLRWRWRIRLFRCGRNGVCCGDNEAAAAQGTRHLVPGPSLVDFEVVVAVRARETHKLNPNRAIKLAKSP
jgi:hypothetical protein